MQQGSEMENDKNLLQIQQQIEHDILTFKVSLFKFHSKLHI